MTSARITGSITGTMKSAVIAMDAGAAMISTSQELNAAMVAFDRWASQNPEKLSAENLEFKAMKQVVKRLRLRLKEQQDMQSNYSATFDVFPGVLLSAVDERDGQLYARSRNNQAVQERQGMPVKERPRNKLSLG